jgi:hypothetical protein
MSSLLKSTALSLGLLAGGRGGCAGSVGFVTTTPERRYAGFSAAGHPLRPTGWSETRRRCGLAGGALPAGAELRRRQDAAPVFDADRAEARILLVGTRRALPSDPTGFVTRAPSLYNAWYWSEAWWRLIAGPEHPIDLAYWPARSCRRGLSRLPIGMTEGASSDRIRMQSVHACDAQLSFACKGDLGQPLVVSTKDLETPLCRAC